MPALTAANDGKAAEAGTDTGLALASGIGWLRRGTPAELLASRALFIAERKVPTTRTINGRRSSGTKRMSSSQSRRLDLTTTLSGANLARVQSSIIASEVMASGPTRNTRREEGMFLHMSSITPMESTGIHLLLWRSELTAWRMRIERSTCMISSSLFARDRSAVLRAWYRW